MALSQVLFYATWYAWDGGGAWGPRFLNAALPFLCLPLAMIAPASARRRALLRATTVALVALTAPIQIGALGVNMNQLFGQPRPPSQALAHMQQAAAWVARAYEWGLAPGRVVLSHGFANTEGPGEALLPRWTLPEASIVVRPSQGSALLTLAASSCFVAPTPTALTVRVAGAVVAEGPACPGLVLRLLLPPGPAEVRLAAPPWRPAEAGIDRKGTLGVYLSAVEATEDGRALPLVGDRLPADPVPLATGDLRRHLGDRRVALWDIWWAYLPLMPLPTWAMWAVAAVWGGVALGCLAVSARFR
jgi:hypothetical protein